VTRNLTPGHHSMAVARISGTDHVRKLVVLLRNSLSPSLRYWYGIPVRPCVDSVMHVTHTARNVSISEKGAQLDVRGGNP